MIRIVLVVLVVTMLVACGGSRHKRKDKCSDTPSDPNAWYYDPGYTDGGYYDGGTADSGYDDTGWDDGSDVSEEKASRAGDTLLEALNYDASAYVLYIDVGDPGARWRRLYLPPVPAAPSGGSARSSQAFRFWPGGTYSLVLADQDGRTLDARSLDSGGGPPWQSFAIVGATLLASPS